MYRLARMPKSENSLEQCTELWTKQRQCVVIITCLLRRVTLGEVVEFQTDVASWSPVVYGIIATFTVLIKQ